LLSVIVPTRNRAEQLARALLSLVSQNRPRSGFEIIVVDNGSRDKTSKVISEFKEKFADIQYIYDESPGLHVGRHRGFRVAKGDFLVFVDDDIEAFPTLLSSIETAFENPNVVLVGGKCLPKHRARMPEWLDAMWTPNAQGERILGYLSLIDLGDDARFVNPLHVFGCNFSIRRSVLLETRGFHPDGMPGQYIRFRGDGETYVTRYVGAKGYKAFYHPTASVYHCVPRSRMTIEYICQRAYNEGISSSYTQIRCAHGLDSAGASLGSPRASSEPSDRGGGKKFKEFVRAARHRARRLVRRQFERRDSIQRRDEYVRLIADAYLRGYEFHQKAVKESSLLLGWILRPDYWDAQIPSDAN
jgi:glucosyl-dolichyl phosphate glucuronosyltransferase